MTPAAHKYFRHGTQARRLYDLMTYGPVTPADIVRETRIYNYHQIIDKIRRRLVGTGVTVKARPVNCHRDIWEYRIATEGNHEHH